MARSNFGRAILLQVLNGEYALVSLVNQGHSTSSVLERVDIKKGSHIGTLVLCKKTGLIHHLQQICHPEQELKGELKLATRSTNVLNGTTIAETLGWDNLLRHRLLHLTTENHWCMEANLHNRTHLANGMVGEVCPGKELHH